VKGAPLSFTLGGSSGGLSACLPSLALVAARHFLALASVAGFGMLKGISVAHCFKKYQFTI
jgi:hypothetical protein